MACMTPKVTAVMIRPGKPPIADQISAARVLAPVPIILNAAKADVWNAVHTFFTEEKVVARDIERIVDNVRNICIRTVFSPVCLRTIPL